MLNLNRLWVFGFVILIFLAPLIGGQFDFTSSAALYLLVLISALLVLMPAKPDAAPLLYRSVETILPALFLLLSIVAALTTVGAYASMLQIFALATFLVVFLLSARTARAGESWKPIAALAAAGIWLGISGIVEYGSARDFYLKLAGAEYRVFGQFITPGFFNPGFFAGFLVMALPLSLALYCASRSRWLTVLGGASFLLEFSALLLTGTRFGAVAAALALVAFVILLMLGRVVSRNVLLKLALLTVLALVPLFLFHAPMTYRVAAAQAQSHSWLFRVLTWEATLNMISDRPALGFGPGTFHLAYAPYAIAGYTRLAHSSFLQIAAESGIPSLAVLIAAISGALAVAVKGLRRHAENGDVFQKILLCGAIAAVIGSFARNLTDSDWYAPGVGITFWLALGLAAGIGRRLLSEHKAAPQNRTASSIASIVVILLTMAIAATDMAAVFAQSGRISAKSSDYGTAVDEYQTAAKLSPLSAEYRRELAKALVGHQGDAGLAAARAETKRAISLESTYPTGYMLLADIERSAGSEEGALQAYRNAERLDPKSPSIKIAIADALERLGRHDEALAVYGRIIAIERTPYEQIAAVPELVDPNYAYAHYALGKEYEEQGRKTEAIAEYEAVINRIDRRNKYTYMLQAQRLATGKSPDDERIQAMYEDAKRRFEGLRNPTPTLP